MAPRDFSEDGAVGAGGIPSPADQGAPPPPQPQQQQQQPQQPQQQTGGMQVSDAGPQFSFAQPQAPHKKTPNDYPVGSPEWQSQFIQDTTGITHPEFLQNTGGFQRVASFEDGGEVGEEQTEDGALPASHDQLQNEINQAIATVDNALSYGRKLHGLPTGEGGLQQDAAAMPTRPAGQSETGIPPAAPGPGTLPPTSNPFGKRVAANYPMPTRPAGQSETGIPPAAPGPGTLPPTSNPFGKRADSSDGNDDDSSGAIPDKDEDVA